MENIYTRQIDSSDSQLTVKCILDDISKLATSLLYEKARITWHSLHVQMPRKLLT